MKLSDYDYPLPEERIARYPLPRRDAARLLVYRSGDISHHRFDALADLLPPDTTLVINTTRVVPARLYFRKLSGALIEVLCLEPAREGFPIEQALQEKGESVWECKVRNLRRWKGPLVQEAEGIRITAELTARKGAHALVRFRWSPPSAAFAEILEKLGRIPLPPYLERDDEPIDRKRYQTVFARWEGAVAAPTAGLHFTPELMSAVRRRFPVVEVLLHVGAGTFQPVQTSDPRRHQMHDEPISVTRATLQQLARAAHITAVGTTAARTLESLYWHAAAARYGDADVAGLDVPQFPYQSSWPRLPDFSEMMDWLYSQMTVAGIDRISGKTRLFIMPPYVFRAVDGLITNFHLPRSTLLLLVDAFVKGQWRPIYQEALDKGYRFLSYGDASLLLP